MINYYKKNTKSFNFGKASRHPYPEVSGISAGVSARHSLTEVITLGFVVLFTLTCLYLFVHGCEHIPIVPSTE